MIGLMANELRYKPGTWSGLFRPKAVDDKPVAGYGSPADELARSRYLGALRSRSPGQWLSDHLKESQRLRGAIFVALKVLGDQAAACKARVYRWHPEARMAGDTKAKEPIPYKHDLARLATRPNPKETFGMLLRRKVHQISLTGVSLDWRVDNGMGKPIELWCVPTSSYQPVAPSPVYPEGAYRVMPWFPGPLAMVPGAWSAGGVVVPSEHIVRTQHPHPLTQWEGLSPLAACELPLDAIESIDRGRVSKLRRGIVPSAVVTMDPTALLPDADDMDRLREEINALLGGPDKAGAPALLSPGLTIAPWGNDSGIEVGWIESWSQLVGFVLSCFGVTKSLAFMSEETTYAALYASLRQFNLFSMCPLLSLLADGMNIGLVWPFWGEDYFLELEPEDVTDEDMKLKKVNLGCNASVFKNNEVRVALGYEPTDEPWGEERVSMRLPPPGAEQGQPGQPGAEPGAGGGLEDLLLGRGRPEEEQKESAEVGASRPANTAGRGSLPPRTLGKALTYNGFHKHH